MNLLAVVYYIVVSSCVIFNPDGVEEAVVSVPVVYETEAQAIEEFEKGIFSTDCAYYLYKSTLKAATTAK